MQIYTAKNLLTAQVKLQNYCNLETSLDDAWDKRIFKQSFFSSFHKGAPRISAAYIWKYDINKPKGATSTTHMPHHTPATQLNDMRCSFTSFVKSLCGKIP